MVNIKDYLKSVGISKIEFAEKLKISRPTLDTYISLFEEGSTIPKERYQIIFETLFTEELERERFFDEYLGLLGLLDRDEKLGVNNLDVGAADMISQIKNHMYEDMSSGNWNKEVYSFIDMLIVNYKQNDVFSKLAEYFYFLNYSEIGTEPSKEQMAYFANFYKTFHFVKKCKDVYEEKDLHKLQKRRDEIVTERIQKTKEKQEKIKQIVAKVMDDMEQQGIEVTYDSVLKAVQEKLGTVK